MAKPGRPPKEGGVWICTVEAANLLGVSKWWLLKNRERFPDPTWRILNPFARRVSYRWHKSKLLEFWERART